MWDQIGDFTPFEDIDLDITRLQGWDPLNRALYLGSKTILPGLLLSQKGDRPAMANSVEIRYPFLDEDLIEFCASLPPKLKLRGFTGDKYLLREYAEMHLPTIIARRRKRMFRVPVPSMLFANSPPFVDQLLSDESLRKTGYFKADVVKHCRNDYRQTRLHSLNRITDEIGLTGVVATQLWHHTFLGGGLCELPVWPTALR
jgi:asparagine synthase (glutamine-hydrolysing)